MHKKKNKIQHSVSLKKRQSHLYLYILMHVFVGKLM